MLERVRGQIERGGASAPLTLLLCPLVAYAVHSIICTQAKHEACMQIIISD